MCAKSHLLIFSSFLDIWENVEWPRFFGPPCVLGRTLKMLTAACPTTELDWDTRTCHFG